jgi:hypothetical protein
MPAGVMPRQAPRIEAVPVTAFYLLKALIPRRLQIALRRAAVWRKRAQVEHVWPIDVMAWAAGGATSSFPTRFRRTSRCSSS